MVEEASENRLTVGCLQNADVRPQSDGSGHEERQIQSRSDSKPHSEYNASIGPYSRRTTPYLQRCQRSGISGTPGRSVLATSLITDNEGWTTNYTVIRSCIVGFNEHQHTRTVLSVSCEWHRKGRDVDRHRLRAGELSG